MKKKSVVIYFAMVILLSVSAFIFVQFPTDDLLAGFEAPASKPVLGLINALVMLVIYGGLGLLGLFLSDKNGFPELWNDDVKKRLPHLSLLGCAVGFVIILADVISNRFLGQPKLSHPSFPSSIFASVNAGIGEEIIFRLFFISFWFWLCSKIVKSDKGRNILFGVIAALSALAFAAGHFPAVMLLYGYSAITDIPAALMAVIIGLNGLIGIVAAYCFRKYGFLAAVLIHFWCDIPWHVIYGAFV